MASKTFKVEKSKIVQVSYSKVTEDHIDAMGVEDEPPIFFSPHDLQTFIDSLLAKEKIQQPGHRQTRAAASERKAGANVDASRYSTPIPLNSNPTARTCPFTYHNEKAITMKQVFDWWSSVDEGMRPADLADKLENSWTSQDHISSGEPFTRTIVMHLAETLSRLLRAIGFRCTIHQEMVIGSKVDLETVDEDHDWTEEVLIVFEGEITKLSGRADLVMSFRIPRGVCPGAVSLEGLPKNLSAIADIVDLKSGGKDAMCVNEFKREANLTAKGLAQAQAVTLGSMTITKCTAQTYVFVSPTKWVFGLITLSKPLSLEEKDLKNVERKNYTLAVIELRYQGPAKHNGDGQDDYAQLKAKEAELLFKLWSAWTIVTPKYIMQVISTAKGKKLDTKDRCMHLL